MRRYNKSKGKYFIQLIKIKGVTGIKSLLRILTKIRTTSANIVIKIITKRTTSIPLLVGFILFKKSLKASVILFFYFLHL